MSKRPPYQQDTGSKIKSEEEGGTGRELSSVKVTLSAMTTQY